MKFKTGDTVCVKDLGGVDMSITGFVSNMKSSLPDDIKETPTMWVVCKYPDNKGIYRSEIFHEDQLILSQDASSDYDDL